MIQSVTAATESRGGHLSAFTRAIIFGMNESSSLKPGDEELVALAQKGDQRAPNQIPESERDYFLERKYPSFGNLAPRDIAYADLRFNGRVVVKPLRAMPAVTMAPRPVIPVQITN